MYEAHPERGRPAAAAEGRRGGIVPDWRRHGDRRHSGPAVRRLADSAGNPAGICAGTPLRRPMGRHGRRHESRSLRQQGGYMGLHAALANAVKNIKPKRTKKAAEWRKNLHFAAFLFEYVCLCFNHVKIS